MGYLQIKLVSLWLLLAIGSLSQADSTLLQRPDVTVDITYQAIENPATRQSLARKTAQSVDMIRRYYGRFPVKALSINFIGGPGTGIQRGQVFQGKEAPLVLLWSGQTISEQEWQNDWIVSHEMIHTALANLPDQHHWMEEGLPTYLEPIIKAQAGHTSAERVWQEFYHRMKQGQPARNDKGLDNTPTWGRTYWGGAAFFLLADVAIRQKSHNRASLKEGLRHLAAAGLTLNRNASIQEVLKHLDNTAAGPVVSALYRRHAHAPHPFELDKLWRDLGIAINPATQKMLFDNKAPLAHIRQAMTGL